LASNCIKFDIMRPSALAALRVDPVPSDTTDV
jgi:hypothetical protein